MSRTRFLSTPLAALIIVGLLIMGGLAISRISWAEGYKTGLLAAGLADGAGVPYIPGSRGFGVPGFWGPSFGGLIITLGLIFVLFLVAGKFFRFWAWNAAWGPGTMARGTKGEHWARHWHQHRPHGPMPPWCWGWEEPSEEKPEEPEPGIDTGDPDATANA